MSNAVRVRFAPSPTGNLHVGGARTALFNYYFARRNQGTFILRVEDTDAERNKKEYEEEIIASMAWLGMTVDEGPYYQSQRNELYEAAVKQLLDRGKAYKCYCTTEELDQMREELRAAGKKPMYNRKCRDLSETKEKPYVIRFKVPVEGETVLNDLIKGEMTFAHKELDDFVIARSNGRATYQLTVVVDDKEMKITHVLRGDDHLNNTVKQMLLMQALGGELPNYAHVPMILGPDKKKLSKRHGAQAVSEYRTMGYLPEAIRNGLIRLGWSHGDQEFFEDDDLKNIFSLEECGVSPSVFDLQKIDFFNKHYIQLKSNDELFALINDFSKVDLKSLLNTKDSLELFEEIKSRAVRLGDFVEQLQWYLFEEIKYDEKNQRKISKKFKADKFSSFIETLSKLDAFDQNSIDSCLQDELQRLEVGMGDIGKPARMLLTGSLGGPSLSLVMATLGKEKCLKRLNCYSEVFSAMEKN